MKAKHWVRTADDFHDILAGHINPEALDTSFIIRLHEDGMEGWRPKQRVIRGLLPSEKVDYRTAEEAARSVVEETLERLERYAEGCRALLAAMAEEGE